MDLDDLPAMFTPSINDELHYANACHQIDKAGLEELRELSKTLARLALCTQKAAMRELAKKAAAGEAVRWKYGSE